MNITLKQVPADLHRELTTAARRHGRSLNTEAIQALERSYLPPRIDPEEQLERLDSLQRLLPTQLNITPTDLVKTVRASRR